MNKKSYKLAVRIPLIITCSVAIVIAVISIFFYILSRNTVTALLNDQVTDIAALNTQTVESYLTSMQVYSESLRDNYC